MKNVMLRLNTWILTFSAILFSFAVMAQEGGAVKVDVTKTTSSTSTTTDWYANPWIWVVGAAVFILLFAAIIRGGSDRRTDA